MNAAKKTNPEKWKFKLREMNLIKKNRIKNTETNPICFISPHLNLS